MSLHQYMKSTKKADLFLSESEKTEKRKAVAAEIGLAWPPPKKQKKVGAPSRQQQWTDRLYQALANDQFATVCAASASQVPDWWARGMPLDGPPESAVAAAASALPSSSSSSSSSSAAAATADPEERPDLTLEDISAAVAEDTSADILGEWSAAAPEESATAAAAAATLEETVGPARRKNKNKFFVPREAQVWFLRWAHHMHVHHDASWRQSWAVAAKVCPQLFAHSDADSFRRWRPAEAEPAPPPASGRKSPLSVAERQEVEVLVHSLVSRGVSVSLTVTHAIFAKKLKPVTISRTWVYYFLRSGCHRGAPRQ